MHGAQAPECTIQSMRMPGAAQRRRGLPRQFFSRLVQEALCALRCRNLSTTHSTYPDSE
jgi:hypothetical protein